MRTPRQSLNVWVAVLGVMGFSMPLPVLSLTIEVRPEEGSQGLAHALMRAREARAIHGQGTSPIRIVLKSGHFTLTEPLLITASDSGTAKSPLIIEAERPGTVTLAGGALLPLKVQSQNRWHFLPPDQRTLPSSLPFDDGAGGQFYVDGRRAVLAREPEVGNWWFVRAPSTDTVHMAPGDDTTISALLRGHEDRAILHLMQSWTSGMHRIKGRAGGESLKLQPAPKWPMLNFGTAQRYFIANVPEALDSAGEWLQVGSRITYIPSNADLVRQKSGAVIHGVRPLLATLLQIQGNEDEDVHVRHVRVQGLRFAYTSVPIPAQGWVDMQAALDVPATIEIDQASGIQLTNCQVRNVGGHGIWLRRSVRDVEISRNVFDDLGAGAVRIGDHKRGSGKPPTGHIKVKDNVVLRTGRDYPGAVGIWVGKSGDNTVSNNVIGHTSYTGISLGWTWGFEPQGADNNIVQHNVLFDIGQGTLSDLGGIYTLGQGRGTRISGNLIRQVQDYPFYGAGAWGIYNDEGSSQITVDGNVVLGTRSGGYHLHYGRDNNISRNIFAGGGLAEVTWSSPERSGKWKLSQTTTSSQPGTKDLHINSPKSSSLRGLMGLGDDPNEIAKAQVKGGTAITDVRLDGAAAWQEAILNAVMRSARTTLQGWSSLKLDTGSLTMPELTASSRPPALPRSWRFDSMPIGAPLTGFSFEPTRKDDPVVRIGESPGAGSPARCLLLLDGGAQLKKYEPYIFTRPNFPLGGASSSFSIWLDKGSHMVHEWRDKNGADYKSILKVTLSTARGLEVDGKTLSPLPEQQWLDITVHIGQKSKPHGWSLTLSTGQDHKRQWRDLPLLTKQTAEWGWAGWISDSTAPARTCLGHIALRPGEPDPH